MADVRSLQAVAVKKVAGSVPRVATVCAIAALVNLGLMLAAQAAGRPPSDLTRDPLAITGGPPYVGLGSNAGILVWCGAAAIALFSAALLGGSRRATSGRSSCSPRGC